MTDSQLIHQYVQSGSESAFTELVRRHLDWVHSAAARQVRDHQLAEDVAQAVFIALAHKAPGLRRPTALPAWLFRFTRCAAANAVRTEARRKHHEREAAIMRPEAADQAVGHEQWEELAPILDELVARLGAKDQLAVLLRFYQQRTFAEVAEVLGTTEPAAARRVERAVERLRGMFGERGLTVGSAALSAGLLAHTTQPAGAALVTATSTAALAAAHGSAGAGTALAIAKGAMNMMAISKATGIGVAVLAVVMLLAGASTVGWLAMAAEGNSPRVAPVGVGSLPGSAPSWGDAEPWRLAPGIARIVAIAAQPGQKPPSSGTREEQSLPCFLSGTVNDPADPKPHYVNLLFIQEGRWPGPPEHVRPVTTNRPYLVGGIPEGSFYVFAVMGSYPSSRLFATAIGLPDGWPKPIKVSANSPPTSASFCLSVPLTRAVQDDLGHRAPGEVDDLTATNTAQIDLSVYGRVVDEYDQPIPFATVQVREYAPEKGGGAAPDLRSNMQGYYGFGPVEYRYRVSAFIPSLLKGELGFRYHFRDYRPILEGRQQVDFKMPPWPKDTGSIRGQAVDEKGQPIARFAVIASSPPVWPVPKEGEAGWTDVWDIHADCFRGQLLLPEVPAGQWRVNIIAMGEPPSHENHEQTVVVGPGKTAQVRITVPTPRKDGAQP